MAKDLIYSGLDTFTLEEEKKKKKKAPITPLYPEIDQDVTPIPENTALLKEPTTPPAMKVQEQPPAKEQYTPKTREEWEKWIGFDKMEDLEPYTDERREKRSQQQQDMYNLAQGLRSVMQGIAGSGFTYGDPGGGGAYLSKFEQDTSTPRIQAELIRIRDAADADERRVKLQNFSAELQKMGLYSDYLTREGGYEHAEGMQDTQIKASEEALDKSIESRKEIAEMSLAQSKEQHAKQYDAKWQQELSNITQARQEALYKAQTEEQKQRENDKYDRMEEYQQHLKDNGLKSPTATEATKIVARVTDKDGKEHELTQMQINMLAFDVISRVRDLSKTGANTRKWRELSPDLKKYAYESNKITERENEALVRRLYYGEFDKIMGITEGDAGTFTPLDDSEAGSLTQ